MKALLLYVLLALSPMAVCAADITFDEQVAINERYLEGMELKFEAAYPRANIELIYCRVQALLNEGKKTHTRVEILEERWEQYYRASDEKNEKALSKASFISQVKALRCNEDQPK